MLFITLLLYLNLHNKHISQVPVRQRVHLNSLLSHKSISETAPEYRCELMSTRKTSPNKTQVSQPDTTASRAVSRPKSYGVVRLDFSVTVSPPLYVRSCWWIFERRLLLKSFNLFKKLTSSTLLSPINNIYPSNLLLILCTYILFWAITVQRLRLATVSKGALLNLHQYY